jgi:hypothetical protein
MWLEDELDEDELEELLEELTELDDELLLEELEEDMSLPPPHAQQAVLAVSPSLERELPYAVQLLVALYHSQV